MRINSWLANLFRRIRRSSIRSRSRRQLNCLNRGPAMIERLESRQLMTVGAAAVGFETRVNSYTPANQYSPAVAMDAAGASVTTWTSNGQDGSGAGVYAQRYNAAGVAQGSEFRVNTFTTNDQKAPAVAIDNVGAFVIAWESAGQDGDGYGIYAQRYNAAGAAQGTEFLVNSITTNDQLSPSVAMDGTGNFVIAWQHSNGDGNLASVAAEQFNAAGVSQGFEFQVNTYTTNDQASPSVAMDAVGNFVITWASTGQDGNFEGIYAQQYNANGTTHFGETRVNTYTTDTQRYPSVARDAGGAFVISWESFTQDGNGVAIEAQRFSSGGIASGGEIHVNTYTTGSQSGPAVAIDSTGDFVVTWNSNNGQDGNLYGIYGQRFDSAGVAQGSEFRVNTYTTGNQESVAVAMDGAGDFVTSWISYGQDGSGYGVYSQKYITTVGPIVTAVLEDSGPRVVQEGDEIPAGINSFTVAFSETLNAVPNGVNSVTNPANWRLTRYGVDVSSLIEGISFGYQPSSNRDIAQVSFFQPLTDGVYELVARQSIHDLNGQPLDGEADGISGGDFHRDFTVATAVASGSETRVNTYTTGNQGFPSVAMDAIGDYVTVWHSDAQDGSGFGIYGQRYNSAGAAQGTVFKINTYTTGSQAFPSAAMDAAGDFVVTWQSFGQDGSSYGIYGQRFNAAGGALGNEFQVNTFTTLLQSSSSVAMDAAGDFAVTWESANQDGSGYGIFARYYNAAGIAQGVEFQVNTYTPSDQMTPDIAMDAAGDFVVAWRSEGQDADGYGIFAQRFNSTGVAQGIEFRVNTYTTGDQQDPSVAMNRAGDFVVTWDSIGQDGASDGIYAQRYSAAGNPSGGEVRVNTYTTDSQTVPSAAMDAAGDLVITWTSYLQDGDLKGIYAQRYDANGLAQGVEFQVNSYTTNDQRYSAVAMDKVGDFVIAWKSFGQDGSNEGIYSQRFQADVAPDLSQIESTPLNATASLTTPVTSSLLAVDQDDANLTGATIHISSNFLSNQDILAFTNTAKITGVWDPSSGTMTLTGNDTVLNYRAALRSVTYHNFKASPNTAVTRTIDFQVTDGMLSSNVISRDLTVTATSTPAVLSGVSGTGTYGENNAHLAIAGTLVITDPNAVNLTSATVSFTNWQAEDRADLNNIFALQHTFSQNLVAHTATLIISGSASVDHYQTLLRSVVYWDVSDNPNTSTRIASFTVTDGLSTSNVVKRNIAVLSVNDAPVLSAIEASPLAYKANDPAFPPLPISASLMLGDSDSTNITKATVQITAGYQSNASGHDVLSFTNQLGITGSFNAATGLLTLTGTSSGSNYRTALRSVKFSSSGTAVSTATRTLSITATDDFSPTHATSIAITRDVTVSLTNFPPSLAGIPATVLTYARGTVATKMAPAISISDPDSVNLTGATIQITTNYQNGQDVLAFTVGFGVSGSFATATGKLTLTGTTSLANYETLLRSVTYKTNTASASALTRTITFIANDGLALSNQPTRNVTLT